MITAWIKNLKTEAQRAEFYKQFRNSADVLERLKELIKEDMQTWEVSEVNYDNPNWAYRQSHINGQRSYANRILKLINLDQKDTK